MQRTDPIQPFLPFDPWGEVRSTPVEFIAYTASSMLSATFELLDSRLSDALNAGERFRLRNVTQTTLESMVIQEFSQLGVSRQDLVAVHATGPRGDPRRRFRGTRQAVSLTIGPYHVQGWIHSAPGAHPALGMYHRQSMVPVTDAEISYVILGRPIVLTTDAIIVNRDAVTSMNVQSDGVPEELRIAFPDITFTGSEERPDDSDAPETSEPPEPGSVLAPDRKPTVSAGGLFRIGVLTPPYLARPPRKWGSATDASDS
jgi:hypothetical protein